jgi:crotonobetainyl-CoA:carnitine CoA-transferase CaiB-like acyl-CoA transferase
MPTPLGHLKMLDLSRQLPGPFASTMLADLGVDVLVVASPNDPFGAGMPSLGRNKRSMTLNLKSAAGHEIFRKLVSDADILLEGFRPGVTERLGIDYATLSAENARLIYCAISGYGQDGPYRDKVGHDVNYLGYAGVLNFIGEAGRPPAIPGVQIADIGAGSLMAVIGILAAVIAREQTGRGQLVDIAMLDGALAWNVYQVLLSQLGRSTERGRSQLTGHHPCYAVYGTRDERYVTVGAYEPAFWAALCRHFGREDFIDKQWEEGDIRVDMFDFFRSAFRQKTLAEWLVELEGKEICFGPVNTIEEALADPQVRHRQMVLEIEGAGGRETIVASPIKLSATPPSVRTPPPSFGEHTEEVLRSLGYGSEQVRELRAAGVIA